MSETIDITNKTLPKVLKNDCGVNSLSKNFLKRKFFRRNISSEYPHLAIMARDYLAITGNKIYIY